MGTAASTRDEVIVQAIAGVLRKRHPTTPGSFVEEVYDAATEAGMTREQTMAEPTEAQIEAAYRVLREEIVMPYEADIHDYIASADEPSGEERERALAKLRAADDEAERKNRDIVRRALKAALAQR